MSHPDVPALRRALDDAGLDGWLFYDFRGSDPIGRRILGVSPDRKSTRRWLYLVPRSGEPRKLVHAIEPHALDELPGTETRYVSWRSLHDGMAALLAGCRRVAMQYSPLGDVPYVAAVDAGTIERVRSLGVEVVSSADLIQRFDAVLRPEQIESHRRAGARLRALIDEVFAHIGDEVRAGRTPSERTVLDYATARLRQWDLVFDHEAVVAFDADAADPHFEVPQGDARRVREGSVVLFDVWAKEKTPGSVYADITWCAVVGERVPDAVATVFDVARRARDAAVAAADAAFRGGGTVEGFRLDRAARDVVEEAGFGDRFLHRTGHSIHEEVHGSGANLDDFETHDTRALLPGSLFSVEPGIYLPDAFGIRTEVDVLHTGEGAEATGPPHQTELVRIR